MIVSELFLSSNSSSKIDEFLNSEAEELAIDRCNAFIRRIIHQEARMRWPNKLRLEGRSDSNGQCLVVQRTGSKEEEEKKEAERREKEQNEVKQAVGLSALLKKIADAVSLPKFSSFSITFRIITRKNCS